MNDAGVGTRATEAVDLFIKAVDQIPSAAWDQQSNLEGWSIRDLVAHTTGTAAKIVTLVEGGEVWEGPSEPDDWKSDDPAGQLRDLAARLHGALVKADLDALREALTFPIVGLTIHTWDVYRSQDRPVGAARGPVRVLPSGGGVGAGRRSASAGLVRAGPTRARGRDADGPVDGLFRAPGYLAAKEPNARCRRLTRCGADSSASSEEHRRRRPRPG